ncbi:Hypothetical protein CINCED_3A021180 [Cinara cedri]|uniref:Uncharacterized protein n=1 Tax=Cinara cedri TaxID=506608 RepID=A0A5E4NKG1_9HEMI|nr:Hypothetical protein CINCED_3A021180 [Cinara cedri]
MNNEASQRSKINRPFRIVAVRMIATSDPDSVFGTSRYHDIERVLTPGSTGMNETVPEQAERGNSARKPQALYTQHGAAQKKPN